MKVLCVPRRRSRFGRDRIVQVKAALPFAESARGLYTHRVRDVLIHHLGGRWSPHMSVGCWCGASLLISPRKHGRLVEAPSADYVVCATCEGRAIGSGQLGARLIAGREVRFQPHALRWCP